MSSFRIFGSILCLGLVSACSHYRMGSPGKNEAPLSVWIEPVIMDESVAGVAVPLNRELREAVIRDGSFRLSSDASRADRILRVTITRRERESLARHSDDTGLSDILSLELYAEYEASDHDGNILKTGEVSVEGQIFREAGFGESSRQRLVSMLRDLADDILHDSLLSW